MTAPSSKPATVIQHFDRRDLRAASQLVTGAVTGVVDIVEGVHHAVLRTLGAVSADSKRTTGITGLVYRSVRGVTGFLGGGLQRALTLLEPLLPQDDAGGESIARAAVVSAINGVLGDQLDASGNPLAIRMSLRCNGVTLDLLQPLDPQLGAVGGKLLLLIHGLCMNDRQWSPAGPDADASSDHAAVLARERGYVPVFLRYNSGRAIAHNGAELAALLEALIQRWPVPVTGISVLAHSMGGLLIRSAIAQAPGSAFSRILKSIVFLGTPHHGAPLERAGNWIDVLLGSTRWSAPFARLGQLRSAGITDLRHGHVIDVHGPDQRFQRRADHRSPLPLPAGVTCFTIAATTAAHRDSLADRLPGDGLVPLASALGDHPDPKRALDFAPDARRILYRTGHLKLLHDPQVARQLLHWLD